MLRFWTLKKNPLFRDLSRVVFSDNLDDLDVLRALMTRVRGVMSGLAWTDSEAIKPCLRILHLSDILYSELDAKYSRLLSGFKTNKLPRPDLIFVTGDLTQNQTPKQYGGVLRLLAAFAEAARLPVSRLFVVPGDKEIEADTNSFLEIKLKSLEDIRNFSTSDSILDLSLGKLSKFKEFQEELTGRSLKPNTPYIAERSIINNVDLGIIGINSNWNGHDSSNSATGVYCHTIVSKAIRALGDTKPQVTLLAAHHPLPSLLRFDRDSLPLSDIDIILSSKSGVSKQLLSESGEDLGLVQICAGQEADSDVTDVQCIDVFDDHVRSITLSSGAEIDDWYVGADATQNFISTPLSTREQDHSTTAPVGHSALTRYLERLHSTIAYVPVSQNRRRAVGRVKVLDVYTNLRLRHPLYGVIQDLAGVSDFSDVVELSEDSALQDVLAALLLEVGFSPAVARSRQEQIAAKQRLKRDGLTTQVVDPIRLSRCLTELEFDELLARKQTILLMSGPTGCGKTMALRRLALGLIEAHEGNDRWAKSAGFEAPFPIPLLVSVGQLWRWLFYYKSNKGLLSSESLSDILLSFLQEQVYQMSANSLWLRSALDSGRVIVLLDGLNQVYEPKQRSKIIEIIRDFVSRFSKCRYVVTTRQSAVSMEIVQNFQQCGMFEQACFELLHASQIKNLCYSWADSIEAKDASMMVDVPRFLRQIALEPLGRRPMSLVTLLYVFVVEGNLPTSKAKLYDSVVRLLTLDWIPSSHTEDPHLFDEVEWFDFSGIQSELQLTRGLKDDPITQQAGISLDLGLQMLQSLALVAYRKGKAGESRLEIWEMEQVLADILPKVDWPEPGIAFDAFFENLATKTGLISLEETGHQWVFSNPTLFRYLTARYICQSLESPAQFLSGYLAISWWRPVIVHCVEYMAMSGEGPARSLVRELWNYALRQSTASDTVEAMASVGESIESIRTSGVRGVAAVLGDEATWKSLLVQHLSEYSQPGSVEARFRLSRLLGAFGDPRAGVEDDTHLVMVPAGIFWMGGIDSRASEDEKPPHQVMLFKYRMAKFPITCGQYLAFILAGGYENPRLWRYGIVQRDNLDAFCKDIALRPSEPVVMVSWFEACAYCAWLCKHSPREDGWIYRLPTEAEWEKAARGGLALSPNVRNPEPQRIYPHGNEFDRSLAQNKHSNPSGRAPIGCYSGGRGPYGTHDQVGNIWEWCLDTWSANYAVQADKQPTNNPRRFNSNELADVTQRRIVRGGDHASGAQELRVSFRNSFESGGRDGSLGFRICVSPPGWER